MKIKLTVEFNYDLKDIVDFISKDKPLAARKFKIELIKKIQKDLKQPFLFKNSIYIDDENVRDYVFKGYTVVFKVDIELETVSIVAILKHRNSF
ncbi:type II toxin-antitoxin system RelE/ParE family toxin [Flavobacterium cellulosilyticum]|uniref:Type II toxin-antitoxin system RelE/ParE family toxin n=1 Tax=Flavobacterium cellulosilyticum TaxID=2541731 RepID=A0A4R5CMA3_9FLAO|nr:type II toxin-antitoxin system RelE/ParE family toxin [Flavobacterium cellulosilyticum]TDD98642.1 type II toxin-antitoxin system RelE/ParE family toxin [Flavobacterium cellulosilyticum]